MWLGVIRGATSRRAEGGRGGGCCAQEVLSTPFSWRMSLNYLTGVWLKHVHLLSLCLAVEGMDGIWVMDMQTTNSLVEHTASAKRSCCSAGAFFLPAPLAPWMHWFLLPEEVLMWAGCVPVCRFCSRVMHMAVPVLWLCLLHLGSP